MITVGLGMISIIIIAILFSFMVFALLIGTILWIVKKMRPVKHPSNLTAIEDYLAKEYGAESIWIALNISNQKCRTHYFKSRNFDSRSKPVLVLVHGVDSAAITWLPIWKHLEHHFNIIAIDVAGFGRSCCVPGYKKNMAPENVLSLYNQFFLTFCDTLQLSRIVLVGHSFGAYLSLSFAASNPQRIHKLLLVSPAGLLPTMDTYGYYWGAFYYTMLPKEIIEKTGRVGKWAFNQFASFVNVPLEVKYWYYHWKTNYCGRDIFKHFISFDAIFQQVRCTYPLFNKLATLRLPVGFVYGSDDRLTPIHQGMIIRDVLNPDIPVAAIPQTSHMVTYADDLLKVVEAIYFALDHAAEPKNSRCVLPDEFFFQFKAVANPKETAKIVNEFYSKLRSICL